MSPQTKVCLLILRYPEPDPGPFTHKTLNAIQRPVPVEDVFHVNMLIRLLIYLPFKTAQLLFVLLSFPLRALNIITIRMTLYYLRFLSQTYRPDSALLLMTDPVMALWVTTIPGSR